MLQAILAEFRHADRPLCAADVSRALSLDVGVVEGMLHTLAQRGKIHVITPTSHHCDHCPSRGGCMIMDFTTVAHYSLAQPSTAPSLTIIPLVASPPARR